MNENKVEVQEERVGVSHFVESSKRMRANDNKVTHLK